MAFTINVWINEERYRILASSPVAPLAQEAFAGLKVIRVPVTEQQKDVILSRFPQAKCDTSTTRSIELLPREAKDRIFALVAERRSVDIIDEFLRSEGGTQA